MSYWILIIILFIPTGGVESIHYLEAFKSRGMCVKVMEAVVKEAPPHSYLYCFPAKLPLPEFRLPIQRKLK